jgi:hypothetical protein
MPRKSKLQKTIEAAAETPEVRTFQPYTYIRCLRASLWDGGNLNKGSAYLFMGWITNGDSFGDNAVLMDDRGPFTVLIREEDFEVCK